MLTYSSALITLRAKAALELRRRGGDPNARPAIDPALAACSPLAFVHNYIAFPSGEGTTPYQDEILEALAAHRRVAVRGPHGIGKTTLAAWVALWATLTADDVKVPTTASTWRQLTKYLWPEIHKWAVRLCWDKLKRRPFSQHELLSLSLKLGATREAFAVASSNAAYIEGAHAKRIVYVYDEAKMIPDTTWDATEGAFAGAGTGDAEAYALAISTPGEPQGRFHQIHHRAPGYEDWYAMHIAVEQAIASDRVSREWVEQRRRQWGEQSPMFQNRVLGEFAASASDALIPLAWVEIANEYWYELSESGTWGDFICPGVDVGRGGDRSVIALRHSNGIRELRYDTTADTMAITGRVKGVLDAHPGSYAVVDVVGIGAGVVDRLREMGHPVVAFNAGESSDECDSSGELGFANRRAAVWWAMRERLDPANGPPVALPPDDLLTGDLTALHWKMTSTGRILVESKDDVAKHLGRSTDAADAVIMALFGHQPLTQPLVLDW